MNSFTGFDYSTEAVPSPCYLLEESLLRRNLELIRSVRERAGVEIILAFKSFALWKTFPVFREYIPYSTASSLSEALLAYREMGSKAHTFAPVYTDSEFDTIADCSSHITFNSVAQYMKYRDKAQKRGVSCGLRINPEYSPVETGLYNPCAPGSRLGVTADALGGSLPDGIEGLHFHTLCESTSHDLEQTLLTVERRFGSLLDRVKWLNMGGGHLMTRKGYDTEHLVSLLRGFKSRHPNLHIILEPGSAFTWCTGVLVSTVEDIVENHGVRTAMLNVSFACHMPDCLEMPYQPYIIGAENGVLPGRHIYRMGGNSCLSGDFVGDWSFDRPLQPGDRIVFEDMIHYTTVKTTMFNGITHPPIAIRHTDGRVEMLREFRYEDYRSRMD
ncbi:MAG: carboxynorspermidine decarboxylase [bacterium]|uniref:Carboxynorspermidine/carboxyspermidine decarboxylase n=1 Tax=Candidatus Aphodosoma intestinipullorum TaxID=2840674 RepID=A0A940DIL3_9BACT|nr:carboxynorspermidine decarboxylase [Candidatus Aphodosoma intestinipullorum]